MKGIVKATSTKFGCAINVNDVWFKCVDIEPQEFNKLNLKNKEVEFEPDNKRRIHTLNIGKKQEEKPKNIDKDDSITKAVALKCATNGIKLDPFSTPDLWEEQKAKLKELYYFCLEMLQ